LGGEAARFGDGGFDRGAGGDVVLGRVRCEVVVPRGAEGAIERVAGQRGVSFVGEDDAAAGVAGIEQQDGDFGFVEGAGERVLLVFGLLNALLHARAVAHRGGQPTQQEDAQHHAAGDQVDDFWNGNGVPNFERGGPQGNDDPVEKGDSQVHDRVSPQDELARESESSLPLMVCNTGKVVLLAEMLARVGANGG